MRAAICALMVTACAAAAAQDDANFKLSNPNAPIESSADHCDAALKDGTVVCTGKVLIRQGDLRLHADTVRIHAPGGKADKLFANGRVVIDAPSGTATGDSGVYDVTARRVLLKGKVVLVREENVVRGETLAVDLVSGVADLGGETQGGRIQGLFVPNAGEKTPGEPKK